MQKRDHPSQNKLQLTRQNSSNEILPSLSKSASVIVRSAMLSNYNPITLIITPTKSPTPIRSHLFGGDIRADHHVEDDFELVACDVAVLVEIVHRECDCNEGEQQSAIL